MVVKEAACQRRYSTVMRLNDGSPRGSLSEKHSTIMRLNDGSPRGSLSEKHSTIMGLLRFPFPYCHNKIINAFTFKAGHCPEERMCFDQQANRLPSPQSAPHLVGIPALCIFLVSDVELCTLRCTVGVFLHSTHINDVIMSYLLCSQICKYRGWEAGRSYAIGGYQRIVIQGLKAGVKHQRCFTRDDQ